MQQIKLNHHQKTFIEMQTRCALCGNKLQIKTKPDYEFGLIREEAYCKKCDLKTRNKEHIMQ